MSQLQLDSTILPLAVLAALACAPLAFADDMASFATGGYARGLRTMDEMHKIDTDGDGTVSKAEWLAYQEKSWAAFTRTRTATSMRRHSRPGRARWRASQPAATPGVCRRRQMMHKIDTDGDGTVSHDEFIAYQTKVFDMMDKNHTGSLGPQEFLGK